METLVLAASYEPIARVPWQRAISLWYVGKVEIVEEYDKEVHSVSITMKVPSVVRFYKAVRGKGHRHPRFSRENVYARDKGRCQYCGKRVKRSEFTYDHVVPKKDGGRTNWKNIVTCCVPCNRRKGGRTPEKAGMSLRMNPERPKSLPPALTLTFIYREGMPKSWRQYLYDISYWHGKLDED